MSDNPFLYALDFGDVKFYFNTQTAFVFDSGNTQIAELTGPQARALVRMLDEWLGCED
jgi:hypothetical protein